MTEHQYDWAERMIGRTLNARSRIWWAAKKWTRRLFTRCMYCKNCGRYWSWWTVGKQVRVRPLVYEYVHPCPVCKSYWWRDESC